MVTSPSLWSAFLDKANPCAPYVCSMDSMRGSISFAPNSRLTLLNLVHNGQAIAQRVIENKNYEPFKYSLQALTSCKIAPEKTKNFLNKMSAKRCYANSGTLVWEQACMACRHRKNEGLFEFFGIEYGTMTTSLRLDNTTEQYLRSFPEMHLPPSGVQKARGSFTLAAFNSGIGGNNSSSSFVVIQLLHQLIKNDSFLSKAFNDHVGVQKAFDDSQGYSDMSDPLYKYLDQQQVIVKTDIAKEICTYLETRASEEMKLAPRLDQASASMEKVFRRQALNFLRKVVVSLVIRHQLWRRLQRYLSEIAIFSKSMSNLKNKSALMRCQT